MRLKSVAGLSREEVSVTLPIEGSKADTHISR